MRVIAGKYRSRPLRSLRGMDIRPTSDRLRETLFNVLCAGNPDVLEGTVWLDLYAGTGAVGIEALSRGAAKVYFAESSKAAADLIAANLKSLGITTGFEIARLETSKAIGQWEASARISGRTSGAISGAISRIRADFVFLDPPYRLKDEYAKTLAAIAESSLLQSDAVVIAEHEKRFDPADDSGALHRYRKLEQGDAALSFYRKGEL